MTIGSILLRLPFSFWMRRNLFSFISSLWAVSNKLSKSLTMQNANTLIQILPLIVLMFVLKHFFDILLLTVYFLIYLITWNFLCVEILTFSQKALTSLVVIAALVWIVCFSRECKLKNGEVLCGLDESLQSAMGLSIPPTN